MCRLVTSWPGPDTCVGACPPGETGPQTCIAKTKRPYGPFGLFGTQAASCGCADLNGIAPVGRVPAGPIVTAPAHQPTPPPPPPQPLPRPPNERDRRAIGPAFGGTVPGGCTITGEPTPGQEANPAGYNCIGWSLCSRLYRWVWLPPNLDTPATAVAAKLAWFDQLYGKRGWTPVASCAPERGKRKIALYCNQNGPTHAAKQVEGDVWESKFGSEHRATHPGTGSIEGGPYGRVCRCYEKSLRALLDDARQLLDEINRAEARGAGGDTPEARADAERHIRELERMIAQEGSP